MKTKKSLLTLVLSIALLISYANFAQAEKESYIMVELTFILPNIGMESAMVSAIKAHNNIYHADGPYKGYLHNILTSEEAGWYVWAMGPCTFTDLDSAPGEGAHENHWQKNVAPNIKKYGRTEFWKLNTKFSHIPDEEILDLSEVWIVDLKRGNYYRFKAIMEKIKEAIVKKGEGRMRVYSNQFSANDGRDIAIVWSMKNFAELDDESTIKKEYEEINGEGSWINMLDEWKDITESVKSQLWKINIAK